MKYIFQITFLLTLLTIEFLATATVGIESVTLGWDKLNHLFAFMVLYILLSLAFRNLDIVYKILLLIIFGLQIEIVQLFLPPREFSYLDIAGDIIGILFGFLIYQYVVKFLKYK